MTDKPRKTLTIKRTPEALPSTEPNNKSTLRGAKRVIKREQLPSTALAKPKAKAPPKKPRKPAPKKPLIAPSAVRALAEAHWSYVKSLLEAYGIDEMTVQSSGRWYQDGFVRGYLSVFEGKSLMFAALPYDHELNERVWFQYKSAYQHGAKHAQEDKAESMPFTSDSGAKSK